MDLIEPLVSLFLIWSLGSHTPLLHLLELLQLFRTHAVQHDVLRLGHQDLSPPKGHQCEEEEDEPGGTDEYNHDGVPDVE